jgi:hypothetical protein
MNPKNAELGTQVCKAVSRSVDAVNPIILGKEICTETMLREEEIL